MFGGGASSQADRHRFTNPNFSPPFIHVSTEVMNELTGNSMDLTLLLKDYSNTLGDNALYSTVYPMWVVLIFCKYHTSLAPDVSPMVSEA